MIPKDLFCEAVDSMRNIYSYQMDLNKVFKKYKADGYIIEPDSNIVIMKLLRYMLQESSELDAINYFCLDMKYGTSRCNNPYQDRDGQKVTFKDAGDLYEYIISNLSNPAEECDVESELTDTG